MPELTGIPSHQQYPQQYQSSTMDYYQRPVSSFYPGLATTAPQASIPIVTYDQYAVSGLSHQLQMPTGNGMGGPVGGTGLPNQHRASSGAWTQEDDRRLLALRAMGKNWNQIQREQFPTKTGNACRKRHERLMERRGQNDFDNRKLEKLSKEYMSMRKEIWQPLAARCGEKWNVVEMQCMSNGLKNIQSHARAYSRRERLEAGQPINPYEDVDDSGISGIGLTPIGDDDDDVVNQSYSSPEPNGSTGPHSTPGAASSGSGSTASHSHHATYGGAPAMHSQNSYQGYNAAAAYHGYSNSVSSTGTAGYGNGGQGGNGGGAVGGGQASQGASPYMGHGNLNRLPSVGDMGIDAIINRGPGSNANGV